MTKSKKEYRFARGYERDAGVDIIIDRDMIFPALSTVSYELNVNITPNDGYCAVLCARTSAANKGLVVAMCPIDPDFVGNCTAIVHNVSNKDITYKKGESFCQFIMFPFKYMESNGKIKIKRKGKRSDGKLGSTGR